MLNWIRDKFIFNHQLAARCIELERSLNGVVGQNEILTQWNTELRVELREVKTLLFKRAGIIEGVSEPASTHKPIQRIETWRTARAKLETTTKLPVDWGRKEQEAIDKGELGE
jgi:hypothetical protein